MNYESLDVHRDVRGVVYVTLNTPLKRNLLSPVSLAELTALARSFGTQTDIRAVVLTGAGKVFCAGGDLNWMHAQIHADRSARMAEARKLAGMLRALNEMPHPLIVRAHGGAFGGGIGLCCVADVALAETGTRFCFSETCLGLTPATIGPYVVARIGEGHARRVILSARLFQAVEAERLGLVARAVAQDELDAAVEAEVAPYLSVAPGAVSRAKAFVLRLGAPIDDAVIDESIRALADSWDTDEAAHGVRAFLEKAAPRWEDTSKG